MFPLAGAQQGRHVFAGAQGQRGPILNPAVDGLGMPAKPGERLFDSESPARRSENYYDIKSTIFNALIDVIDLTQLSQIDREAARDEIRDIVSEIITLKDVVMSVSEQEELLEDIWGASGFRSPRTVDVHMRHLREKLERKPKDPEYLFTVRGVGYRFRDREPA